MQVPNFCGGGCGTILQDARLGFAHISLYMALYQRWCAAGIQTQVQMTRQELMELSKISSSATYHKCLRQLVEYGYVIYIPSFNPAQKSRFGLLALLPYTAAVRRAASAKPQNK